MALDSTTATADTTAALAGVTVSYLVDEVEARQRLSDMVRSGGPVAIDIETAPHAAEVEKLTGLIKAKEIASGKLRALRKLKAPAPEIANSGRRGEAARGRDQVRRHRWSRPKARSHTAVASLRRRRPRPCH